VAQWGSRIDNRGSDLLREARSRIEKINPQAVEGGAILVSEFLKGSVVAGLKGDRIKYVVKAKSENEFLAQLVETALQKESEIHSQKFKGNQNNLTWSRPEYSGTFRKESRPQVKREVM
jgi:hypothetical protein